MNKYLERSSVHKMGTQGEEKRKQTTNNIRIDKSGIWYK